MYSDNILVTGANGQLGRSLRREVHQKGWTGNWLFTDAAELDITDNTAVARHIAENDISVVVNCAAYTNVDKAEDDREAADLLNNVAVANIAAALAGKNAVFIHVSTDYVFDGESCIPYKEDDAALPCSVYGITKKRGMALFGIWQEFREDHAFPYIFKGDGERGFRPGRDSHIRGRSCRCHLQGYMQPQL